MESTKIRLHSVIAGLGALSVVVESITISGQPGNRRYEA
jgi:hypothetical protein